MSPRLLLLILLCLRSADLAAQQNFFNVPSSEITEDGKIFLQQQINVYGNPAGSFVSSTEGEEPVFPSFGINGQKQIEMSERRCNKTVAYGFLCTA